MRKRDNDDLLIIGLLVGLALIDCGWSIAALIDGWRPAIAFLRCMPAIPLVWMLARQGGNRL